MPGLTDYSARKLLDHLLGTTAFTAPAAPYVQLHKGDPGENGTTNASANTSRQQVAFAAASGSAPASAVSSAQAQWTNWPSGANGENISHFSTWDAGTAGNCTGTGAIGGSIVGPGTADPTTDKITCEAHSLVAGDRFQLLTVDGGVSPGGLDNTTIYFVVNPTTDDLQASLTSGGSAIDITSKGKVIVQKLTVKPMTTGDSLTIASGQLVASLD